MVFQGTGKFAVIQHRAVRADQGDAQLTVCIVALQLVIAVHIFAGRGDHRGGNAHVPGGLALKDRVKGKYAQHQRHQNAAKAHQQQARCDLSPHAQPSPPSKVS